jgi:pimeloyl-ACP methyl ester carboxylesterase
MITRAWVRPRLAFGVSLLLGSLLATAAFAQTPSFKEGACPFLVIAPEVEGETIVCGRLIVPENRARPSSPTISLQVAIVLSPASEPAAPIVYLEGGPGGSAVVNVPDVWTRSALRRHTDLLIVDQRGTGYSTPSLDCPEFLDDEADDPVRACRDRLTAAGVDLGAYQSRESARDVADLLAVLNIEKATLFGVSYGTRLALTIMRDHPKRIVSAILDGVYPPHVNSYNEQAENGFLAFERLFNERRRRRLFRRPGPPPGRPRRRLRRVLGRARRTAAAADRPRRPRRVGQLPRHARRRSVRGPPRRGLR